MTTLEFMRKYGNGNAKATPAPTSYSPTKQLAENQKKRTAEEWKNYLPASIENVYTDTMLLGKDQSANKEFIKQKQKEVKESIDFLGQYLGYDKDEYDVDISMHPSLRKIQVEDASGKLNDINKLYSSYTYMLPILENAAKNGDEGAYELYNEIAKTINYLAPIASNISYAVEAEKVANGYYMDVKNPKVIEARIAEIDTMLAVLENTSFAETYEEALARTGKEDLYGEDYYEGAEERLNQRIAQDTLYEELYNEQKALKKTLKKMDKNLLPDFELLNWFFDPVNEFIANNDISGLDVDANEQAARGNQRAAQIYAATSEAYAEKHKDDLNYENILPFMDVVTTDFARVLPQYMGQIDRGLNTAVQALPAAIPLFFAGRPTEAKKILELAYDWGQGQFSYEQTAGATIRALMDEGLSYDAARDYARSEGFLSGVVEGIDAILDATAGKAIGKVGAAALKKFAIPTWARIVVQLGGQFGINIAQEYAEEFVQEVINQANMENALGGGKALSTTELAKATAKKMLGYVKGEDPEGLAKAKEAGSAGARASIFPTGINVAIDAKKVASEIKAENGNATTNNTKAPAAPQVAEITPITIDLKTESYKTVGVKPYVDAVINQTPAASAPNIMARSIKDDINSGKGVTVEDMDSLEKLTKDYVETFPTPAESVPTPANTAPNVETVQPEQAPDAPANPEQPQTSPVNPVEELVSEMVNPQTAPQTNPNAKSIPNVIAQTEDEKESAIADAMNETMDNQQQPMEQQMPAADAVMQAHTMDQAENMTEQVDKRSPEGIGYAAYYEAGVSGAPIGSVTNINGQSLSDQQKQEAYEAGRKAAGESLVQEVADSVFAPSHGKEAKLVSNEYTKRMPKQTVRVLNALAQMTGTTIIVEDMADGINGSYDPKTGTIRINAKNKNAALVVAAHEITHRMQQVAPEQYRQFRDYVVNAISAKIGRSALEYTVEKYANQDIELTTEQAMDELVSDFTMDMVRDHQLFQELLHNNRTVAQKVVDAIKDFISKVKDKLYYSYETALNSEAMKHYGVDMDVLENAAQMWEELLNTTRQQTEGGKVAAQMDGEIQRGEIYSVGPIIDHNGKSYGIGVHLDSTLLDGLTSDERLKMVKEYVKELGGKSFTAYDNNGNAIDITVAEPTDVFWNRNGKKRSVNKDLTTKYIGNGTKQEAVVHVDELIETARFQTSNPAKYPHGWLDNKGKNKWDVWKTYIQDKNKTIWEATLHVANTANGKKIIYDIDPIQMVGRPGKSGTTPTTPSIRQTNQKSNPQNSSSNGQNSVVGTETFRADRAKELMDRYGTIYPGENPHREAKVPRKTSGEEFVSQTIRTVLEAKATPDAAVPTLESLIASGEFSYERYTDKKAMEDAKETVVELGYNNALTKFTNDTKSGKVSKRNTALGWELYRQAANAGDMESAISILNLMVEHQRNAAQAMQATRILKKMDPDAQLFGVQRSVSNLQQELNEKFKNKAPDLKIDEDLARRFLEAQTDAERNAALQEMYQDIGRQIPSTLKEKWDNWRYLAMLGNFRTHIRNFTGNAAFMPVRGIGNQLSALGQALFLPKEERTRSLGLNVSAERKALVDAAKADFDTHAKELVMSGEKYNSATNAIDKGKRIFRFKPLEAARKINGNLLELEDTIFSKQAYASALAGYLNAKGYSADDFTSGKMTEQQKADAREFAINEAQRATYRDSNAFSDFVSSIGFKNADGNIFKQGVNDLVEGVMPFKKTPANILARAFEYGPGGLLKTIVADIPRVAKGDISANQFIDNLSRGLTGAAVVGLGYLLAQLGIIKGTAEDEDQEELEGRQNYSLEVGKKSITLDWLAPGIMPLFMGAELYDVFSKESGGDTPTFSDVTDIFKAMVEPMQTMSMLDGLNSTIESAAIAAQNDGSAIGAIAGTSALNYFMQAFPTIAGQIERAFAKNERKRQTTFVDKETNLNAGLQYTLARAGNKIPLFDYHQVDYIDAWGRTQDNGNVAQRTANNMLNPAYASDITETDVDREIKRLEAEFPDMNLTPARVTHNQLTVNEKEVFLTEDEFVTYSMAKGQNDFAMRTAMMNSPIYQNASDGVKARAHNIAKEYAVVLGQQEAGLNPHLSDWQKELQGADEQTIVDTLIAKATESEAKAIGDKKVYAGYEIMIDNGQINDVTAELLMPEGLLDVYSNPDSNYKDILLPTEVLDAYSYINRYGSNLSTDEKLEELSKYLAKEYPDDNAKSTALNEIIYGAYDLILTADRKIPASELADRGEEGMKAYAEQLTFKQKAVFNAYVEAGGDILTFDNFMRYANDATNDSITSRKTKINAWLFLNIPDEHQRNILYHLYYNN